MKSRNYNKWHDILVEDLGDLISQFTSCTIKCPFHDDRHPSLYLNFDNDYWICYSQPYDCGSGNIAKLVAQLRGISLIEAEKLAINRVFNNKGIVDILPDFDINFGEKKMPIDKNIVVPDVYIEESEINYNDKVVPHWVLDRGFTKQTMKKWRCGMDMNSGALVIPVLDHNQNIAGYIRRNKEGVKPKYLYTKGMPRSYILFGLGNLFAAKEKSDKNYLLITEGSLDTIWLEQHGYPAVAILGSKLSNAQRDILATIGNFSEIILCLDSDKAGQEATKQVKQELGKLFFITEIGLPQGYKDIQEVRRERMIHEAIDNRRLVL